MTTNSTRNAFPLAHELTGCAPEYGLTKREYFAGLALQGLLLRGELSRAADDRRPHLLAQTAIDMADLLLEKLELRPSGVE